MKKKTRNQRNVVSMSVIMLMLVAGMLTACSNSKTEKTTAVEGTEQVGEPAQDNATITETSTAQDQENEDTVVSENVEESASEKENEGAEETETQSVVYEGIDMDSTLPGLEWMDTFDGIIHEPKIVVFNDETNKKVIVENGDVVEFALTDTMATYVPADKESSPEYQFSCCFENYECIGRYTVETELSNEYADVGITFRYANNIIYGDEKVNLWCKLKILE